MSAAPRVAASATIADSVLGAWTAVGERTSIADSTLGDYSYVVNDCSIMSATIGKFCSIAAHCRLNPGNHPLERVALHHFTYRSAAYDLGPDDEAFFAWRRARPVTLGHDVWIGHGAVLLPGVSIGTGAAVGAGAVVSRDVPPFAVAAGVPARVHRYRFAPAQIAALERIAWWDWPHDGLHAALHDFRALDIDAFIARYA